MSNYTQITFFAPKDALLSGNPAKLIKGADVDPELAAIATAISSKYDSTSIASAPVGFNAGSVSAPSIYLGSSTTTGLYQSAANVIAVAVSGVLAASISASGLTVAQALTVNTGGSSIKGALTVGAPTSGIAFTVVGVSGGASPAFLSQGRIGIAGSAVADNAEIDITNTDTSGGQWRIGDAIATSAGTLAVYNSNNNRLVGSVTSVGNWSIPTPASGLALTVNQYINSTDGSSGILYVGPQTDGNAYSGNHTTGIALQTASSNRLTVNNSGNVTVNAPASGTSLTIGGVSGIPTLVINGNQSPSNNTPEIQVNRNGSTANAVADGASAELQDITNNTGTILQHSGGQTELWQANGSWVQQLRITTAGILQARDQGGTMQDVGWRVTPQNNQGSSYTIALSDRGKIVNANTTITITVPSGVFVGGDVVSVSVGSGASVTIAQGSGTTLQWAGNGSTTGNRTMTGAALATIVFLTSTVAMVSGAGLS